MKKRTIVTTEKHEMWVIRRSPKISSRLVDVEDIDESTDNAPMTTINVSTQTIADENKSDDA